MNELAAVREEALGKVAEAEDLATLESLRVAYLGKKGALTGVLKSLGKLPPEERPAAGAAVNAAKEEMQAALEARREALQGAALGLASGGGRGYYPAGRQGYRGGRHPHAVTMARIVEIFRQAGYAVASGPEVESDYYNFEALNIPAHHPARAMHDTFYLEGREEQATGEPRWPRLLRTHTSPVQARIMENTQPPIRIICPGKVYRVDSDVTLYRSPGGRLE